MILYTERFVLSNSRADTFGDLFPLNPQAETQEGGYTRDSLWRIGGVRQGLYGDQSGIDRWIVKNNDPCDLLEFFGWNWLIQFILKIFSIPECTIVPGGLNTCCQLSCS